MRARPALQAAATLLLVAALLLPAPATLGGAAAGTDAPGLEPVDGPLETAAASPASGGLPDAASVALIAERAAAPASPAGTTARDGAARRFSLVTGETLLVRGSGDERALAVRSGAPVRVVTTNDRTFVFPKGVDLSTYDRSLFALDALRAAGEGGGTVPVLLETDASAAEVEAAGLANARRLESAGVVAAELDPARAADALAGLVADGRVRSVSLDREVEATAPAGRAAAATTTTPPARNLTGAGVTVAVLDTGIDATHPDLRGRVVDRVDLVGDDGDGEGERAGSTDTGAAANGTDPVLDANGHGTLVAGVLAGSGAVDANHTGVAPGADLMDVRVMNERGAGRASTIVAGIEYAVEHDADVVLLSISTSIDGSGAVAESVAWAAERGTIVVAAAGNDGRPRTIGAPGRPPGAITVGATDGRGAVAAYSSRGPTLEGHLKPDLLAPGREVVGPRSSDSGRVGVDDADRYTWVSGTSVAAPQVAGAVALLLEAEPGLTAREVEARLGSGARPVDGGGALAQGSGVVDVGRALDPDVVVSEPAVDFGLIESDRTLARTLTFENRDDRPHVLTFDVAVRNVDAGVAANRTAELNRSRLTLAPGERARVRLSVHANRSSGAHAGTIGYAVDGAPRRVAFGFVRGGRVTVEKRPLTPGARVDGEPLWVLTERGTHDELLEFENGTASFVAGGGTYLLWSWGTDEPTGTTVFLSERRGFSGPERVVLDESETVPVGVDAAPLVRRYGPLANHSVTASMSTPYGDDVAKLSVSEGDAESRTVRVSPDPDVDVATTYLLATEAGGPAALDAADVFQLGHGVRGVREPSVFEARPERLRTVELRLHRTTVDETYRVQDRMAIPGVWNQIDRRWFDLGDRRVQRVHRYPADATYHRDFRGEGWDAYREPTADDVGTAQVLAHPMLGRVGGPRVEDGEVRVTATPFSDGAGTRFDPPGEHRLAVSVDGEVVRDVRVRGGRESIDGVPVEHGQDLLVRLVGENAGGRLSTRTLTEVAVPDYDARDRSPVDVNRPPTVADVDVLGAGPANAVPPGEVTAVYDVEAVGPLVDPTVWYAAGAPSAPPWEDQSGWARAETSRFGGRLRATFEVGADAGTLSLAASFRDVRGHRTRTMTTDAVHVGAAPNTSTSVLAGRFLAPDGGPAGNDTIVVDPVGRGAATFVSTGPDGRVAVELPNRRSYDLTYLRGEPWAAREPAGDRRPAWLPLERVRVDGDVDLGTRTLPRAATLDVRVTDERGEPVPGATVRVSQRAGNVSVADRLVTNAEGVAVHALADRPGLLVAGRVSVEVDPPAGELYPAQGHRLDVSMGADRRVDVTLETAPPVARVGAFGTFQPGAVVFLHARESDVPAGVLEYRWDLDGDGTVERVTQEPTVRYVPAPGQDRVTLTVLDRAGKTDESTLTLPVEWE